MCLYCNIEVRSRSHCCHGKGININLFACIHPLVIQHISACAVLYYHLWPVCLALLYFPTMSRNGNIFEKKNECKNVF